MLAFTIKLLLWSYMFIYFVNTTTLAQPQMINSICENASNFTKNSIYQKNLDRTLSTLPSTNSGFGFFNSSAGKGNNKVNSVALCRGDVNPDVCRSCLTYAIVNLQNICPNQKEAIGYYDYCFLKYSNQTILGKAGNKFHVSEGNIINRTNIPGFNFGLSIFLTERIKDAAKGGSLLKFSMGDFTRKNDTNIYALVQCTPELSGLQCSDCLIKLVQWIEDIYNDSIGVRILTPTCNIRYETYQFYNKTTPPAKYSSAKKSSSKKIYLVIGTLLISVVLIFFYIGKKKVGDGHEVGLSFINSSNSMEDMGEFVDLHVFDLSTIVAATNNFSPSSKLGEGGFGSVYKGMLLNGQEVAVKRLSQSSRQGMQEFKNEVNLIAKLQHVNLVRLFGYCFHMEEKILIYEYLPNKDLDSFIFDQEKGSLLDWKKRFQIIRGIVRGLQYLHQDSSVKIIHRDLKASNVLLDADFNPKISDFGVARIFGRHQAEAATHRVVGTCGYISPEYAMEGLFSEKSDVYSFGILLLEIISGRKNNNLYLESSVNLIGLVWDLWKQERALEVVDSALGDSFDAHEILLCIHVGILCVQELPNDRPTMTDIDVMLSNREKKLPIPNQPTFVSRKQNHATNSTTASARKHHEAAFTY